MTAPDDAGSPTPETPLVSVVMIFLDTVTYLDEAVASVLAQTVPDLELILVDDGSTDGSLQAAEAWADRDPRVVALHHPGHVNRGMGASRALGTEHARGRWVAFLDGDDVWLPDHLDRQLRAAAAHPEVGIVVSPARIWTSWRGEGRDHDRPLPYEPDVVLPAGALLESVTFSGTPIPTCGLMFQRDLVPPGGPADPEFRGLFEDQTMVARLTVQAPAVAVPVATSLYRQHPRSAVNNSPGRGHRDPATLRYLTWIETFLGHHGQLTAERRERLAAVHATFRPRWRFWVWYSTRWLALRVLPGRVRTLLRRGRMEASGVPSENSVPQA